MLFRSARGKSDFSAEYSNFGVVDSATYTGHFAKFGLLPQADRSNQRQRRGIIVPTSGDVGRVRAEHFQR